MERNRRENVWMRERLKYRKKYKEREKILEREAEIFGKKLFSVRDMLYHRM